MQYNIKYNNLDIMSYIVICYVVHMFRVLTMLVYILLGLIIKGIMPPREDF